MSELLTPEQVDEIAAFGKNRPIVSIMDVQEDLMRVAFVKTIRAAWAERDELQVMFNSSQASLSAIVADAKQKVKTIEAERDHIMKLLHDLTPMGSEFANNPERCAKWVCDKLNSSMRLTADAYASRNKFWAERDELQKKIKELETDLKANVSMLAERDRIEANRHRLSPPANLEDIADAIIRAERDQFRAEAADIKVVLEELLEVADLRGDTDLPHPADDPKTWTARMQEAWDTARDVLTTTTLTAQHIERDKAMEQVCKAALSFDRLSWVCLTGVEQGQRMAEALEALKAVQGSEQEGEGCEI